MAGISDGAWGAFSVDTQRGLVFIPMGQPAPQYYGGARPGQNLYASSVVALDANTGRLRWYFQLTHHDIFDMDVVTPVVLYDTTVDGRPRKGIAVLRTDGYLFLLDRVDGSPLLPIEERPVPQDPYQATFPTQPFPVGGDQVVPNCVEPWLMLPADDEPVDPR